MDGADMGGNDEKIFGVGHGVKELQKEHRQV